MLTGRVSAEPGLRDALEQQRQIVQAWWCRSREDDPDFVAHAGGSFHRRGKQRNQNTLLEVGHILRTARPERIHLKLAELLRRGHDAFEKGGVALAAFVNRVLEIDEVIARVAACISDMLPNRFEDRDFVLAPFVQMRAGFVELGQHILAPDNAIGGAPGLEQLVFNELLIVDRAHARALGEGPRILEAAALDGLSDHDRLGFLREFRRYIKHRKRQDLCAAGQLELGRSVGCEGKGQQPEVVKRIAAPVGIVVLGPECLVPVAGVGEIVENHLPDLAALLIRQTRLHARRFGGDMLDDLVRRSTRLDCGTLHDEIDCAQRQILDIETIGDRLILLENNASIER